MCRWKEAAVKIPVSGLWSLEHSMTHWQAHIHANRHTNINAHTHTQAYRHNQSAENKWDGVI